MKRIFSVIFLNIFLIFSALAQKYTIETIAPEIVVFGETFQVTYYVVNYLPYTSSRNFFTIDTSAGIQLTSKTPTYNTSSIQTANEIVYTYAETYKFSARKEGKVDIPTAIATINNATYKSKPQKIKVVDKPTPEMLEQRQRQKGQNEAWKKRFQTINEMVEKNH